VVPRKLPGCSQEAPKKHPACLQEALKMRKWQVLAAEHHQKGTEVKMFIFCCENAHFETPDGPQEHPKRLPGSTQEAPRMPPGGAHEA